MQELIENTQRAAESLSNLGAVMRQSKPGHTVRISRMVAKDYQENRKAKRKAAKRARRLNRSA